MSQAANATVPARGAHATPAPMSDFESLPGFVGTRETARAFEEDGITTPTTAQREAFEPILLGKHVIIDSGTGTGKTLAYLLPLLQRLRNGPTGKVVCLAPAAELAVQTMRVASRYKPGDLAAGTLAGGGNQRKQKDRVQKSTRLIVGTPGRVLEMIADKKLKGVTTFVLDEPEPILGSKDAAFLMEVLSRPEPRAQIIMAGATFGQNAAWLIDRLGTDAVHIRTGETPLQNLIRHGLLRVRDSGDKDLQLARFCQAEKVRRAIVYVNQPHLIRHLYRYVNERGLRANTLSQDRTKEQCKQALTEFSRGEVDLLITTDRAATGIDIADVPWVIHYELPRSTQAYVHRAGRTGRAGKSGRSVALAVDQERIFVKRLEQELGIEFEVFRV